MTSLAVPSEVDESHARDGRVPQGFVDLKAGYLFEAPPHAFAGDHEIEVQVDKELQEAAVGGLVDLGEGVAEEE